MDADANIKNISENTKKELKQLFADDARKRGRKKRRDAVSKKLGEITGHPLKGKSAFTILRRLPGWRADTVSQTADDDDEQLFLEEAVGRKEVNNVPGIGKAVVLDQFPPPYLHRKKRAGAFEEPTKPQDYLEFNRWILGDPIVGTGKFVEMLEVLAQLARNYNAALHWLRRLHFHENAHAIKDAAPPRNPHGEPPEPLPDLETFKGKRTFEKLVREAEARWEKAVNQLNAYLEKDDEFLDIKADMVEVNGYIVSMRVVCDPVNGNKDDTQRIDELGGSSSSHISISSPFSSSSL